jgi:UDPglucose 6-dehydrogenase
MGAKIKAHDPQATETAKKIFGDRIEYCKNEYEVMNHADALIIITEWNQYRGLDLEMAKKLMRGNIILDTRNLLDIEKAKELGFKYEGVGR